MADRGSHRPLRRALSARLLALVVCVLLLADLLIFVPSLQRERTHFLQDRLRDAEIAALGLAALPQPLSPELHGRFVALGGAALIRLQSADGDRMLLVPPTRLVPRARADLDTESWLGGLQHAIGALIRPGHGVLEIRGPPHAGTRLDIMVSEAPLDRFLRLYALRRLALSLSVALVTGGLLYIALQALLVAPMRLLTSTIAAFRTDPEGGPSLDAGPAALVADDEIAMVGRELSAMQAELRTALWRNARLAAVGTAVAKMSHDLRGILSSALLVADRLTMSRDDKVRDAGEVIVRAVHRATGLAQHTLDFVREGPPAVARAPVDLAALVAEAAAEGPAAGCRLDNQVAPATMVHADRDLLLRVLTNLLNNAAEAGAATLHLTSSGEDPAVILTLRDDGPGLPQAVQDRLFKPFTSSARAGGTGLGMAIARDLMRAHGGDLRLDHTGSDGTGFLLLFQQPKTEDA